MNKKTIRRFVIIIIVGIILFALYKHNNKPQVGTVTEEVSKFNIVTSFYPTYIATLNIVEGAQNVNLKNMADATTGCLHDYTLTTGDLSALEKANILIENGLGLESFNEKIVATYPNIKIVNTSNGIETIKDEAGAENAHIWASIDNYMVQVQNIASSLSAANPENSQIYSDNAEIYIAKLKKLKNQYIQQLGDMSSINTVCLNETLMYIGKNSNINMELIPTNHQEVVLSGAKLSDAIKNIREKNVKAIFIDKNDVTKNADLLSNETGVKVYKLDSAITGSVEKDAYVDIMEYNLGIFMELKE